MAYRRTYYDYYLHQCVIELRNGAKAEDLRKRYGDKIVDNALKECENIEKVLRMI